MSSSSLRYFSIPIDLEMAIEDKIDKIKTIYELQKRYEVNIDEIINIVLMNHHCISAFKEAWHDPNYNMDFLDEMLYNKMMESNSGRSFYE